MFTMKKKIISGSLVALMALGLAGCANNSAAPASKVSSHPQTTKVSQPSSKKASSTNSQAASQSSSQASAKTQASYAAQSSSTNSNAQNDQVVNQFVKASGVKENKNTQYMVSQTGNKDNYQVEVRDSQGDPNVSHLDGLYRFNPATNQVQQMNPVTGQFENK